MSILNWRLGMFLMGILLFTVSAHAGPWDTDLLINGSFDDGTAPALPGWTVSGLSSSTAVTPASAPNVLGREATGYGNIEQEIDLLSSGFTQTELDNATNLAVVIEIPTWNTSSTFSDANKADLWVDVETGGGFIGFAASHGNLGTIVTDVQSSQAVYAGGSFNLSSSTTPVNRTWTLTNLPANFNSMTLKYYLNGVTAWTDDLTVKVVELPVETADITITNTGFNTAGTVYINSGNSGNQGQSFTPSVNDGFAGETPETVYLNSMTFWGSADLDSVTGHDGTPVYLNVYSGYEEGAPTGFLGSSTNSVVFAEAKELNFEMDELALDYDSEYFAVFSTTQATGDVYGQGVMWESGKGYAGGQFIHNNGLVGDDMAFIAKLSLTSANVPEPSTAVLLLGAVGAFLVIRRRQS